MLDSRRRPFSPWTCRSPSAALLRLDDRCSLGSILALEGSMRRRTSVAVILVMVFAIVPAASTLPVAFSVVPIAILEPGSLLLLGITFLILASVAQRALFS